MNPIINLKSISEIKKLVPQWSVKHPLVAVIDFGQLNSSVEEEIKISADFYIVMFKANVQNTLKYGRKYFDFQEGSLVCIAPKQTLTIELETKENMTGWGLIFHPDLIRGTSLGAKMKEYSFFSYETSEALHLSEKEKQILFGCVTNIESELQENIDTNSQTLIVSNIELLLNYCTRYYGRQFITRKNENKDTVTQVEQILQDYFSSTNPNDKGLPTVKYLADKVYLSPSYLSDLLKKETGRNAKDHIHYFIIEEAKNILLNSDKTISEIAYSLGFEYPQYFSRLFKQKTGTTPQEYRLSFN